MAVRFQSEPIRASTFRVIQIVIIVLAVVIGIVVTVATQHALGLLAAPVAWFILANASQVWHAEPALDEWDKLPLEVRLELVGAGNPAAWALAKHDRDAEVRKLWWKLSRGK
jgi:hypothetical protein